MKLPKKKQKEILPKKNFSAHKIKTKCLRIRYLKSFLTDVLHRIYQKCKSK